MSDTVVERRSSQPAGPIGSWLMQYAFLAGFAALIVTFTVTTSAFLTPRNLLNVLEGSMILLFVALAMTMVVSSGGIDLSVGVALDFGAWFAIVSMLSFDLHWTVAVLLASWRRCTGRGAQRLPDRRARRDALPRHARHVLHRAQRTADRDRRWREHQLPQRTRGVPAAGDRRRVRGSRTRSSSGWWCWRCSSSCSSARPTASG
jgi:hypothetical protein